MMCSGVLCSIFYSLHHVCPVGTVLSGLGVVTGLQGTSTIKLDELLAPLKQQHRALVGVKGFIEQDTQMRSARGTLGKRGLHPEYHNITLNLHCSTKQQQGVVLFNPQSVITFSKFTHSTLPCTHTSAHTLKQTTGNYPCLFCLSV